MVHCTKNVHLSCDLQRDRGFAYDSARTFTACAQQAANELGRPSGGVRQRSKKRKPSPQLAMVVFRVPEITGFRVQGLGLRLNDCIKRGMSA